MSFILDALKKSEKSRHDDVSSVLPLIVKPRRASGNKQKKSPLLPLTIIIVALAALFIVYLLSSDSPRAPQQTIRAVPQESGPPVREKRPVPTEGSTGLETTLRLTVTKERARTP